MSVVYTLIARQDSILCDYDLGSGNYPSLLLRAVTQLNSNSEQQESAPKKVSCPYPKTNYLFHMLKDEKYGLVYACMADNAMSSPAAFVYLDELMAKFHQKFSEQEARSAIKYGLQNRFIQILKGVLSAQKGRTDLDKLTQISQKLNEAKEIVVASFDKLMHRADEVDLIVKRSESVEDISLSSKKLAAQARQEAYWRNQRCKIVGLVGAGLGILVLVFFVL